MRKLSVYLMLMIMVLNSFLMPTSTFFAQSADDSGTIKNITILNANHEVVDGTYQLEDEEKFQLKLDVQSGLEQTLETVELPEEIVVIQEQNGGILYNDEVIGEYRASGRNITIHTIEIEESFESDVLIEVVFNEELLDENGRSTFRLPITKAEYTFEKEKNDESEETIDLESDTVEESEE